jgi:hypothetical protein
MEVLIERRKIIIYNHFICLQVVMYLSVKHDTTQGEHQQGECFQ